MKKVSLPLDPAYWSNRYRSNEIAWDAGAATTPLTSYFDQLEKKDLIILIPGAGNAYEAEYLVNKGFSNVFVCDVAPEPLANLKKRCPAFPQEHLLHCDFFELRSGDQVPEPDLIIEQTFFCALDPTLRKSYFQKISELLKPGGNLAGVLFDAPLNEDRPPFGGTKEEYLAYIDKKYFEIKRLEPCYNSIKPREGRELFINLVKH
jgi:thiopurine S-methyltransferase